MLKKFPTLKATKKWQPLAPGDVVDIVAPAWACSKAELRGAVAFVKSLGLIPRYDQKIFGNSPLFAQTDAERLRQLSRALTAKDSRAVWCVRGGYGAIRLLPALQRLKAPKVAKLFIGYSDITTLHQFLGQQWHWPTVHGPLLDRFGRGDNQPRETRDLVNLIFGRQTELRFAGLKPLNGQARRARVVRGQVVGGNLATLQSSLGTPWAALPQDRIVFFEDTGERPHRVDRMLTQMQQAGYFNKVRAVIFGPLLIGSKDRRLLWDDVVRRFAEGSSFPVLKGMPSGHGNKQRPLPLLTEAHLQLGRQGTLRVHTGVAR